MHHLAVGGDSIRDDAYIVARSQGIALFSNSESY